MKVESNGSAANSEAGAASEAGAVFVSARADKAAGGSAATKTGRPFWLKFLLTLLYFFCPPLWAAAFFDVPIYGKLFKNRATSIFNSYILPPAAVLTLFFAIYDKNDVFPFGGKTIAWCDMTQQGVPYWLNFKHIIQGKDNLFLNMANASGMDGFSFLRSFFIYPFSYLILLIKDGSAMSFVSVTTALKLAMCSVTAMLFFRTALKKLHPSIAVALSLMYSFCAYGAMYNQIINWPDSMYILPLYFTGLYLLLTKHKILLFSVALSLVMLNISFAFMTVLATLLFMGCYFIVSDDRNLVKRTAFDFAFGSAFAALLTAPLWFPFFGAFSTSARGVSINDALKNSAHFTSAYTVYPLVMSTAFIFVCALAYKNIRKKPVQKAVYFLFGMMLIPMIVEPINKIWHFGSYTAFPARFAYILIFVGLVMSGMLLSEDGKEDGTLSGGSGVQSEKPILLARVHFVLSLLFSFCVCFAVYLYASDYVRENSKEMSRFAITLWGNETSYKHILVLFLMFLSAYTLFYLIYRKKLISKQVLAAALVMLLLSEGYVSINTYVIPPINKMHMNNYAAYEDLADRIDDDGFYRVKNNSLMNAAYGDVSEANFPGALGYPSMGHYSSLTLESYLYAAKAYGYSSVWMKVDSYGGTKFSDALFSIKYKIDKTENKPKNQKYANWKYCISEADCFLPLGIFTDGEKGDLDLEQYTRIELQERVFKAITHSKENLFCELRPSECKKCSVSKSGGKYQIKKSADGACLEYKVQIDGTKTLYFDCFDKFSNSLSEKINSSFRVEVNGRKVQAEYPKPGQNGILDLGTYTDRTVAVRIPVRKSVVCRSFGLYLMDDTLLADKLKAVDTAALHVEGNGITGTCTAPRNGRLFISVSNAKGFKCKVNGKSVSPEKCFGGFVAVPVKKGENSISLTFLPPMFVPSLAICVPAVIAALVIIPIYRKRGVYSVYDAAKKSLGAKVTERFSLVLSFCVVIAFAAVIALIYIYPLICNF